MSDKPDLPPVASNVRTYPPVGECGIWMAALRVGFGFNMPIRPYCYIGRGTTEQEAIDDLMARETADTWSSENV